MKKIAGLLALVMATIGTVMLVKAAASITATTIAPNEALGGVTVTTTTVVGLGGTPGIVSTTPSSPTSSPTSRVASAASHSSPLVGQSSGAPVTPATTGQTSKPHRPSPPATTRPSPVVAAPSKPSCTITYLHQGNVNNSVFHFTITSDIPDTALVLYESQAATPGTKGPSGVPLGTGTTDPAGAWKITASVAFTSPPTPDGKYYAQTQDLFVGKAGHSSNAICTGSAIELLTAP